MRPLIQYDIDEPPTAPSASLSIGPHPNPHRPQTKKRKRNHHNTQKSLSGPPQKVLVQHWDDPGSTAVGVTYDEEGSTSIAAGSTSYADDVEGEEDEHDAEAAEWDDAEEEEEESRPLTHEEIWDDSALIDAWNSAEAEYEAYHGTAKAWKTESVKRSPLWYNKPYTGPPPQPGPSKSKARSKPNSLQAQAQEEDGELEPDTAPLDFDTYVPTHDPSLAIPSITKTGANDGATAPFFVPSPSTTMVSRDEAFNNALSAMYWSGYWTAVYHSQTSEKRLADATDEGTEADEGDEDLVPTQR